ncbi:hypothetical protein [Corynebacterium glyciniphilum]|uniref:hypothetical protein n=1 Tax=Corynebacterium glyciniphilum TaxID=1404244 RepID=UPI00264BE9CA|nr:hypothetical protein [Corynebacterium glyciniphilum]MDN6705431.1 hypothetical protein [Corynebacterium glyciniphilum]
MTMSRVVTVPSARRTWCTLLLSGAAVPRLAGAQPADGYQIGDEAVVLPNPPADFALTVPGTNLAHGQSAEVLTRLPQGPTLYWEISTGCPRTVAPEDTDLGSVFGVGVNPAPDEVDHYILTPYDITFLGDGGDGNPVLQSAVAVPVLIATDATGNAVDPLLYSAELHGGIDPADMVPGDLHKLVEGRTYRGAVLGCVRNDGSGAARKPAGVRFLFQAEGSDLDPLHTGRVVWR